MNIIKNPFFSFKRMMAAYVLCAFIMTNHLVVPSYAATSALPHQIANQTSDASSRIYLPEDLGNIQDVFKGTQKKTVVLIQDAHAIPDAQLSIQKIIDYLQQNYGFDGVALEGVATKLDPQIFKSFPDQTNLRKLFDSYLENGEITGSTLAAVFNSMPATYYGVENWPLYEKGLAFYQQAMKKEPEIHSKLDLMKQNLQMQKAKIYSKDLLILDKALTDFHSNHGNIIDVMKKFAAIKLPQKGTEIALVLEESDQKKDVFQDLEVKKAALEIRKSLQNSGITAADKISFNNKFQDFQTSKITSQAFAVFLEELAAKVHLSLHGSSRLTYLINHQKRMQDIQGTKLLEDFECYAESVKESLFKTPEEKTLNQQTRRLELLTRLAKLELSREAWDELKTSSFESKFEGVFEEHVAFYHIAELRDEVFFEKLTAAMLDHKSTSSILVAGGFHTESLIRKFKRENISYVLVMPQIGSIPENTHYREHMSGNVSWKNYFQVENGNIDLYKAFIRSSRDKLLAQEKNESAALLKNWRDQIIRDLAKAEKITSVGNYTSFLDETVQVNQSLYRPEWQIKLGEFIDDLRELDAKGQLTEQSIMRLLKPSTQADSTYADIAPGSFLKADLFPGVVGSVSVTKPRSEVAVRQELRIAPESMQLLKAVLEHEGDKTVIFAERLRSLKLEDRRDVWESLFWLRKRLEVPQLIASIYAKDTPASQFLRGQISELILGESAEFSLALHSIFTELGIRDIHLVREAGRSIQPLMETDEAARRLGVLVFSGATYRAIYEFLYETYVPIVQRDYAKLARSFGEYLLYFQHTEITYPSSNQRLLASLRLSVEQLQRLAGVLDRFSKGAKTDLASLNTFYSQVGSVFDADRQLLEPLLATSLNDIERSKVLELLILMHEMQAQFYKLFLAKLHQFNLTTTPGGLDATATVVKALALNQNQAKSLKRQGIELMEKRLGSLSEAEQATPVLNPWQASIHPFLLRDLISQMLQQGVDDSSQVLEMNRSKLERYHLSEADLMDLIQDQYPRLGLKLAGAMSGLIAQSMVSEVDRSKSNDLGDIMIKVTMNFNMAFPEYETDIASRDIEALAQKIFRILQLTRSESRSKVISQISSVSSQETNIRAEGRNMQRDFHYPAGKLNVTVTNPNQNQVATSQGVISVGMTMLNRNLSNGDADKFPRIFLTPADQQWVGEDGSNLIQFYFAAAANWNFHKRKTTIVVKNQKERDRVYRYLQLGNPYELPKVTGFEYDEALYQRFRREAIALADRGTIEGRLQIITPEDHMVDFVVMENNSAHVGGVTITFDPIKKSYVVNDQGSSTELAAVNLKSFDVKIDPVQPLTEKPEFGLTFLGTSGGMDINGLTSNAIVWTGKKGILQDAGSSTVALLNGLGVTPADIDYLIITHMHEDHVAGALQFFHWMKAANKELTLVSEPGIFEFFKEQMELVLGDRFENAFPNVHVVASKFYEEVVFSKGENQIRLEAIPAFHGTPTASYRIDYAGKTVSLSSDTTIAPLRLAAYSTPGLPGIPDEVKADLKAFTNWTEDGVVFDPSRADEIKNALLAPNSSGVKPAYVVMEVGYGKVSTITDLTNHTYAGDLKIYDAENQKLFITNHAAGLPASETLSFQHAAPLQTYWIVPQRAEVRSELRQVANDIVVALKRETRGFNARRVAQKILTAGVRAFIPELLAVAEEARTLDDMKMGQSSKNQFEAIRAIERPVVIEYVISEMDLGRMGTNANVIISNLLQAAHDAAATNKNILTRIRVPASIKESLRLQDHNKRDAVRFEKKTDIVTLYNNGLTGYQDHLNSAPTISITAFSINGPMLFSDKYGDNQEIGYNGIDGPKVASQIFAAALVWIANPISQRTFNGLILDDHRADSYRIANQNALYALSSLIELMAQYRSELRIKQAA